MLPTLSSARALALLPRNGLTTILFRVFWSISVQRWFNTSFRTGRAAGDRGQSASLAKRRNFRCTAPSPCCLSRPQQYRARRATCQST